MEYALFPKTVFPVSPTASTPFPKDCVWCCRVNEGMEEVRGTRTCVMQRRDGMSTHFDEKRTRIDS